MSAPPPGTPDRDPDRALEAMRRIRAERLARLRGAAPSGPRLAPPSGVTGGVSSGAPSNAPSDAASDLSCEPEDPAALQALLHALRAATAETPPVTPPPPPGPVADVLPFLRGPDRAPDLAALSAAPRIAAAPTPAGDLARLPGAGPGLVWALERAGIARLADLAAATPDALADRLGPAGALVDLDAWIGFARAAARTEAAAEAR